MKIIFSDFMSLARPRRRPVRRRMNDMNEMRRTAALCGFTPSRWGAHSDHRDPHLSARRERGRHHTECRRRLPAAARSRLRVRGGEGRSERVTAGMGSLRV